MRFGQDTRVSILSYRSMALWCLGYPDAALADVTIALKDAREIGQAGIANVCLGCTSWALFLCGDYYRLTSAM